MPITTEGWDRPEPGVKPLPYVVTPDGQKRYLAANPSPSDHPARGLRTYSQAGFEVIPRAEWKDIQFKREYKNIPILDQNGRGACLPHAWARACMKARVNSGAPFVKLSPWFLYTLINGGADAGSNAGDALLALQSYGICHDETVPYGVIRPKGYSQAAMDQAKLNLLADAVRVTTPEEMTSAIYYGWIVCIDVYASASFTPGMDGVLPFRRGFNNHEVEIGEEFRIDGSGRPLWRLTNSWGTAWGVGGYGYCTEDMLAASQESYAVRYMTISPQDDPELPPPVPSR